MEYLIDFRIAIPDDATPEERKERLDGEVTRVAELAEQGHAFRVWRPLPQPEDGTIWVYGLYAADSDAEMREILDSLPLRPWMEVSLTPLQEHPNDPARRRAA
jgi:muconolactone D-isomerase